MQSNHPFTIYSASAGSGKTYTLVKAYLKILFSSGNLFLFKNILAITFTNKAVAEMKDRIIGTLKMFSDGAVLKTPNTMFDDICKELEIEPKKLHEKSKTLLHTVVHNYAAFDISTIDGFTHKLIRTFAHDLKLPINFEVELDQDAFLNEAVDSLIAKAGTNSALTKTLVDFAIEKADDDKSWDVSCDFNKVAKLLVNENDMPFVETLNDKTLHDFNTLKTKLKKEITVVENQVVEVADGVLALIEEAGLKQNDFLRGSLPKHFKNLNEKKFNIKFDSKWQADLLENNPLYLKKVSDDVASIIDQIQPQLIDAFTKTKQAVFHLKFLRAFYKNITPLSVLNAINNELEALKIEQNKMLISEFNTIISKEIKNQPTPFIYERIGEKFKHYFIDEFQDTSQMQWENLIPLLDNALAAENGSTMLVGDAKQAIYRWRGGKAEQFMDLFNEKTHPFQIKQSVETLEENYRSFKQIVHFNNGFFKFLAHQVFTSKDYSALYENARQNITKNDEGYVSLSFLEIEKDDDRDELFSQRTLNTINTCLENGFDLADICVLTRKKKEGVAVANYLSQHNIPIVSSETLLLQNAPEVNFINNMLRLLVQPKNNEIKIEVLNYLALLFNVENKHGFFTKHIHLKLPELFKSFEDFNVYISSDTLLRLSLYDLAETIMRSFNLAKTSNAYVQFYLDVVLDFLQKKGSDIPGFLNYFEEKKDSLSIVSPEGQNAVKIMTIHKSKGLEFPVVIFPFADLDIYRELEPKEWFGINKEKYNGFSYTLLNFNKDFEYYGDEGLRIFNKHKAEQELDNINLLYVTLTRAVEQLHVISSKSVSAKGEVNTNRYSGLFIQYLKHINTWTDSKLVYTFGIPIAIGTKKITPEEPVKKEVDIQQQFISTAKETHQIKVVTKSGLLWDTTQQKAIEKGNLIHNIMSKINTKHDVDTAIADFVHAASINNEQAHILKRTVNELVNHPTLKNYYTLDYNIYNERDILTKEGLILRPDRVVVNTKKEAVIIDYKTGFEDKKHQQQLQLYQDVLEDMNLKVIKKILVYINDDIQVKEF